MFNKKNVKRVLVTALTLVMVVGTVAFAAETARKKITASYGRVKIQHNGQDVTNQVNTKYGSPAFIQAENQRTYVPVRAIADVLGVDVEWDPTTFTANFVDTKSFIMQEQLNKKNAEIAKLEKRIKELEAGIKEEEEKEMDLADLEKQLQKDYGRYKNLDFDIRLDDKGKDKIEVTIEVNLRGNNERIWERLRDDDKEDYIKDIVKDIQKEFKDVEVVGTIYDSYGREDLYTFSKTAKGSIKITSKDFDITDIEEYAEYALKEDFKLDLKLDAKASAKYYDRRDELIATVTLDEKVDEDDLPRERDFDDILNDIEDELKEKYGVKTFELVLKDHKDKKIGDYLVGIFEYK